jgi:hypothetical protein
MITLNLDEQAQRAEQAKGVRLLHRYITVKSKQFNFEGIGLGEAELGSDPRVGSAVGAELCGDGEAPSLTFFARGERREVVRGFAGFDQGFVQDGVPAFLTKKLGLHLGESDQRRLVELFGQGAFPSLGANRPAFAESVKAQPLLFGLIQGELTEFGDIVRPHVRRICESTVAQHQIARQARRTVRVCKVLQAARPKSGQLRRLDDFGANRIEVNVINDARQNRTVFDAQGLVTALEQVSAFPAKAVEPNREGTLQAVHASGQIGLRGLQGQVVVVGHDDVGMDAPAELPDRLPEGALKGFDGTVGSEDRLPVIAPVNNMIKPARFLQTQFSRHKTKQSKKTAKLN